MFGDVSDLDLDCRIAKGCTPLTEKQLVNRVMGVKGLQTYIDKQCPHILTDVCIFDMADEHRKQFNLTPKLVIDGSNFVYRFYEHDHNLEWIFGEQWKEYTNMIQKFVRRFEDKNIKLVFFFDGYSDPIKHTEWINRKLQKCDEITRIFDCLRNCQPLPEETVFPPSISQLSKFAFKQLCPSVEVYSSLKDADIEIASFAHQNKDVFGILSADTDFIIFDTKPHLSLKNLDYISMCTKVYNRNLLLQHLSLPFGTFPLFACLVGNDFMLRDDLQNLYSQFRTRGERIFIPDVVSKIINTYRWKGNPFDEQELDDISYKICGNYSLKDKLSQGMIMYIKSDIPVKTLSEIEWRHVNCINLPLIFNIYKYRIHISSEVLEEHINTNLPFANLAYRNLRKRIYNIMFNNINPRSSQHNKIIVKEWCTYYGNNFKQADNIFPASVSILNTAPCMEDLWKKESLFNRLRYLFVCLNTCLTEYDVQDIEPKYVVLCCTINYLLTNFKTPLLKKFEISAFIAQAVYMQNKTLEEIRAINIKVLDIRVRAINLCSLFMKGVTTIIFALGVCGYPISSENAMPWNYFDGKIFHKMYILAEKRTPIKDLFKNEISSIKLYKKLYDKATFGVNNF